MDSKRILAERFKIIKKVIQSLAENEASYATEVHKNFDALDMEAIETLAQRRQKKLVLQEQLENFVVKYEGKVD